jgi:hypothetical protein
MPQHLWRGDQKTFRVCEVCLAPQVYERGEWSHRSIRSAAAMMMTMADAGHDGSRKHRPVHRRCWSWSWRERTG